MIIAEVKGEEEVRGEGRVDGWESGKAMTQFELKKRSCSQARRQALLVRSTAVS